MALAQVLALRFTAIWAPWTLPERLADGAELEAIGELLGDPTLRFWAAVWHGIARAETNDAAGVERCQERQREMAARCHQPMFDMIRMFQEGWWALVRGELGEAERLAGEGLLTGTAAGEPDVQSYYATLLVTIRVEQGRLGEMVEVLDAGVQAFPGVALLRAQLALARVEAGDAAGGRALLDAEGADEFRAPPIEPTTLATLATWAETAARLGAAEHAEPLLRWIDPCRGEHIIQATATFGSAGRYAARLHALLGRLDEADERFTAATADLDSLGARAFAARARAEHAQLLVRRDAGGDRERARDARARRRGDRAARAATDPSRRSPKRCWPPSRAAPFPSAPVSRESSYQRSCTCARISGRRRRAPRPAARRSSGGQVGGGGVAAGLLGVAGAGDDRGHAGLVDDPAQRELRHRRRPAAISAAQLADRREADVEVDAGEGLAHVERLAVPVVGAVVVGGERGVLVVPAGQQARGERHAGDDADAGRARRRAAPARAA